MATFNVVIDYVVNKDQLAASNKELEKAEKANKIVQKETDQTTEKFSKQEKQLKKSNSIFASTGDQLKQLGNRFTIAGKGAGDMAAGLINTAKGAGTASKAMKILKVALASTGIGLLVVALGSLATFFTKNQEGADKLSKAMRIVGVVFDVVIDRVGMLGKGLVQFFQRDYSGAFNTLKGAVSGVGEEMEREGKAALQLERDTQKLRDANIAFIVEKEKLRIVIENARLAAEEEQRVGETLEQSNRRRAKATQEAIDATNKLSAREIELAKEKSRLLTIQVGLGESLAEDVRADEEAKAAILTLEAQRLTSLKRLVTGMNRFTDATKESNEATREKIELDEAQSQAVADKDPMEAAAGISAEVMQAGIQQAIDSNQQKNDAIIQSDLIAQGGKLEIAREGVNLVKQVGSENVILQKALALADIGISTAQAVAKATAISPLTFGQPWAGFAIASGIIQATKVAGILPKFREGGYISGNSHDYGGVNIEAEGGEYMARRESVNKYGRSFFESLNNLEIHPDVISGLSGGSSPIIVKSDNSELINEYRNRPINNISISEEGITLRTKRNNSIVQKKVKRYTT